MKTRYHRCTFQKFREMNMPMNFHYPQYQILASHLLRPENLGWSSLTDFRSVPLVPYSLDHMKLLLQTCQVRVLQPLMGLIGLRSVPNVIGKSRFGPRCVARHHQRCLNYLRSQRCAPRCFHVIMSLMYRERSSRSWAFHIKQLNN